MPKVSRQSATRIDDYGPADGRGDDISGYTVDFVSIRQDVDLAPLLAGLPGDSCPCPHWGYVFQGSITVRYGDHEETCQAGDAYYMAPSHVPAARAGTEFVQFSPSEELKKVQAVMQQNAARLQQMQAG
ncbi:MAG TPA: hypothetical protein VGI64_13485 [Streptosporangiaceae bacterium]|jgi:hypothetical protein